MAGRGVVVLQDSLVVMIFPFTPSGFGKGSSLGASIRSLAQAASLIITLAAGFGDAGPSGGITDLLIVFIIDWRQN